MSERKYLVGPERRTLATFMTDFIYNLGQPICGFILIPFNMPLSIKTARSDDENELNFVKVYLKNVTTLVGIVKKFLLK